MAPTIKMETETPTPSFMTPSLPPRSPSPPLFSKKRVLSNMEFFLSPNPLPDNTFSNPALVVLGCSRKDAILNCFRTLFSLSGVEQYRLYLSMGCIDRLSAAVTIPAASHM